MKFLLSIDGGSIRGIIPAYILNILQSELPKPLYNYFDLIGGTSTGGIIALGLSFHDPLKIIKMYVDDGEKIFKKRSWWKFGLTSSKYDHTNLEKILYNKFGDKVLKECKTHSFVTTYDIKSTQSINLKSWEGDFTNSLIWKVCRATSAAPIFFNPFELHTEKYKYLLIDGGLYANNPAMSVYYLAKKLWKNEEFCLLSLGTGEYNTSLSLINVEKWGMINWVQPLLSIIFDGQSDSTNDMLSNNTLQNLKYIRLQKILTADYSMDNVSKENIVKLIHDAQLIIKENKQELSLLLKLLKNKK